MDFIFALLVGILAIGTATAIDLHNRLNNEIADNIYWRDRYYHDYAEQLETIEQLENELFNTKRDLATVSVELKQTQHALWDATTPF